MAGISGMAAGVAKQELPVPKFTFINAVGVPRDQMAATARPEAYILPTSTPLESAVTAIEYDMDEADATFLESANSSVDEAQRLSEDGFEAIMSVCDKLSIHAGREAPVEAVKSAFESPAFTANIDKGASPDSPLSRPNHCLR